MALQEIFPRESYRIGPSAWAGRRQFTCPKAETDTQVSYLWTTTYPGTSGRSAAYAAKVSANPSGHSINEAIIVVDYRTLTNDEYMERFPSKGIVYTRASSRSEAMLLDQNGNMISGVDPSDTTGKSVWKIESGPDTILRPQIVYIVHAHTSARTYYVDVFADKLGMLNSNMMTKLGQYGADAGELLFFRMEARPNPHDKVHYIVDYSFLWSGKKSTSWNELTVSRKWEKKVITVPVLNLAGKATGDTKQIYSLVPTNTTRTAKPFKSYNFLLIDSICQW